tara:strand:+ start:916 stop:1140 length:225 start_codon:yes stop_codon:yes gene_type:complete
MKLIKSRREYKCKGCEAPILKGDLYSKKTESIGQPWKPDEIKKDKTGAVYYEMQGVRYTVKFCESCSTQEVTTK